jgi:hypothetical protein
MQEVMDVIQKTALLHDHLIKIFTTSVANSHKTGTIGHKSLLEADMTVNRIAHNKSHMPKDSIVFEKLVPAALVILGIITLGLILFAAGILLGIIQF